MGKVGAGVRIKRQRDEVEVIVLRVKDGYG